MRILKRFQYSICSFLPLVEKRKALDNKGSAGTILIYMSKVSDSINHKLVITKLYAYRCSEDAIKLIHTYMFYRLQRTKTNKPFSSWSALMKGVPQGSVLFKIYLSDIFYFLDCNIWNFADKEKPYVCCKNLDLSQKRLEQESSITLKWFVDN